MFRPAQADQRPALETLAGSVERVTFHNAENGPCCTDRLVNARRPPHAFRLGDADGLRASKLKHAVEGMNGNGNFGRATPIRP